MLYCWNGNTTRTSEKVNIKAKITWKHPCLSLLRNGFQWKETVLKIKALIPRRTQQSRPLERNDGAAHPGRVMAPSLASFTARSKPGSRKCTYGLALALYSHGLFGRARSWDAANIGIIAVLKSNIRGIMSTRGRSRSRRLICNVGGAETREKKTENLF